MKFTVVLVASLFFLPARGAQDGGDRTITNVVKLLQGMLDKSKGDGDEERTTYGKFKCYCDDNENEKVSAIETGTRQIDVLGNEIDQLLADNAALSEQAAKLDADMQANVASRDTAKNLRDTEKGEFQLFQTDSLEALEQLKQAIDTLAEVGADQTLEESTGYDHSHFMTGAANLVKIRATVKKALLMAAAFTSKKQNRVVDAFLQKPFTGSYTSQAAEVIGILKDMRDTFNANLQSAQTAEAKAQTAYEKYLENAMKAYEVMQESLETAQSTLSTNDGALADKRTQKTEAEETKAADEIFLASLKDMCAAKASDYQKRLVLRQEEETALAEAIAILNSDAAFETFGAVSATNEGAPSFLQRHAIQKHSFESLTVEDRRQRAQKLLRTASTKHASSLLSRIAASLAAGNPFAVVVKEIEKVRARIAQEGVLDDKQFQWCADEQSTGNSKVTAKGEEIGALDTGISSLEETIDAPETGLKSQIEATKESLARNLESQASETASRKESHLAYLQDVKHLTTAQELLGRAITVLQKYYSKILKDAEEGAALVQADPNPPATWDGAYKGQSGKGGTKALSMLETILQDTQQEEKEAHDTEGSETAAYEDSMSTLKSNQAQAEKSIAVLKSSLAQAELDLAAKRSDKKKATEDRDAIIAYLHEIEPGCTFIQNNLNKRKQARADEESALVAARSFLEGTPVFQAAEAAAYDATFGDCLSKCKGSETNVVCKACMAKVTIPGYCAGHPGTDGC